MNCLKLPILSAFLFALMLQGCVTEKEPGGDGNPNEPYYSISWSTSNLNFGSVGTNSFGYKTFSLANSSASTSNLSGSISISGSAFEIFSGGGSFSLAPGEAREVIVDFWPLMTGSHTGMLSIIHNASSYTSPINISLSGTGVLAGPPAPSLLAPENGATNVSTTPTFSWGTSSEATSYRLQISTSSSFSSPLFYDQGASGASQQVVGLAPSTSYFWRVGATNTNGTTYSTPRNFTTRPPIPGEQWTLRSATTNPIYSVTWGGGQFVAVTSNGFITSPDGINWTSRASGTIYDQDLEYITWTGSQFIAVANGTQTAMLVSPNGVSWTAYPVGNDDIYAIARSDSLHVAVGQSGLIMTSTNGSVWTSRPSATTTSLNSIVWAGSKFVAIGGAASVGSTNAILTSSNGTAWEVRTSGVASYIGLFSVASSGSLFVIAGSEGLILTSVDGSTWTQRPSGAGSYSLRSVAWSGSLFVAVGNSNILGGIILTSPDGITWTTRASGAISNLISVAWSGTKFVAAAQNGTVLTSP